MAKEEYIKYYGCIEHLCFYRMWNQDFLRTKSTLTRKRVKSDPAFAKTMKEANLLGRAAKLASVIYKALPKEFRQFWMYRAFTGEIMVMLGNGKSEKEAEQMMQQIYVSVWENKSSVNVNKRSTTRIVTLVRKEMHNQVYYVSEDQRERPSRQHAFKLSVMQGISPPRSLVA